MIDYLISAGFAVLTTCGVIHIWFRTTAPSEYIGLVWPAGAAVYTQWTTDKRALWMSARKQAAVAAVPPEAPAPVTPATDSSPDCHRSVPLTADQAQTEKEHSDRIAKLREVAKQQRKAAAAIRQPDLSVIAWLTETYPQYWIVRLSSCYTCLAFPVAIFASCVFMVPAAAIAVYWVSLKTIELRLGENPHA